MDTTIEMLGKMLEEREVVISFEQNVEACSFLGEALKTNKHVVSLELSY